MSERRQAARQPSDAPASSATPIPLEHLDFRVAVTGTWAEIELTQRFGNRLERPLEAVYVFPLPEESIVRGAVVKIGDRTITAEIRERAKAQAEYAQARDAGHDAAMVEQERPNVFTMSVARIDPGAQIGVTVPYAHRVPWQHGGGRLIIPLVVAPQFIPGVAVNEQGDTNEVPDASRITPTVAKAVPYRATVRVTLKPGFPCTVACASHPDRVQPFTMAAGESSKEIVLEDIAPDGDVVFTYQTTAEFPVVTATRSSFTYRGETEEYLVVQVFPGFMRTSDRPLDNVLLLDGSGSMQGEKDLGLQRVAKKVLQRAIRFGRPLRVAVERFGNQPEVLVPLSEIGPTHSSVLDGIVRNEGTEFGPALSVAMGLLRKSPPTHDRCIVVVTDGDTGSLGYAKVPGVRVHMVGIDTAANAETLRRIAEENGGGIYTVLPGEDEDAAANEIIGLMSGPVLQGVTLEGLPDGAEVIGATDCYQLRPTTFAVRLPKQVNKVTVVGRGEDGKVHRFPATVTDAETAIGAQLWARSKLRELQMQQRAGRQRSDQVMPTHEDLTRVSLRYGIIGPTTAFIAVAERAVPGKEKPERVDVPVMVPRGWDYDAAAGGPAAMAAFAVGSPASGVHVNSVLLMRAGSAPPMPGAMRRMSGGVSHLSALRGTGGPPAARRVAIPASAFAGGLGDPPSTRGGASPKGFVRRTLDALASGVSRLTGGGSSALDGGDEGLPEEITAPIPQGPKLSEVIGLAESLLARLTAGEDAAKVKEDWTAFVQTFLQFISHGGYPRSEDDRCRLFELLSEISQYAGFEIDIPEHFRAMPKDTTGTTYERWERAATLPIRKPKPETRAAR
ncbi:MAG: VIT domain-containing protein [bacterium]|nr:VIT domain-containing protein [bacterium]